MFSIISFGAIVHVVSQKNRAVKSQKEENWTNLRLDYPLNLGNEKNVEGRVSFMY
jgi:hypothetical protein